MLFRFNKITSLLLLCLTFNKLIFSDGFYPGTTILTPEGLIPIEMLKRGDIICSFDIANEKVIEDEVIGTELCLTTEVTEFEDKNGINIICSLTQDFVGINPLRTDDKLEWIKAKNFAKIPPPQLFSLETNNVHFISKVRNLSLDEPDFFVRITTLNNHNLIIGEAGYIAHNWDFNLLLAQTIDASNKITTNTTTGPISAPTTIQTPVAAPIDSQQPEFLGMYLLKKGISSLMGAGQEPPKKREEESKKTYEDKIRLEAEAKYKAELIKKDEEHKKILATLAEQQEMMNKLLKLSLKDKPAKKASPKKK